MTEEMRLLRATVNQQYAEIIKLNRNINALNLEIRKKDTVLINLRERLAKYEKPDKNSNNSSTPPSKERIKDEVIRRTRSLRKPSGKKPGGQKGHDGHKLSYSSIPDEIIDEVPNYCTRWGDLYQMQNVCLKFLYRQPQTLWNSYLHNCSNLFIT